MNLMTKEHNEKQEFVTGELEVLVKRLDPSIVSLTYMYYETAEAEVVNINYDYGYSKGVDVSADSLLAIAKDVLKHI